MTAADHKNGSLHGALHISVLMLAPTLVQPDRLKKVLSLSVQHCVSTSSSFHEIFYHLHVNLYHIIQ